MAEKFDIKSELLEECRFCEATLEGEVFDIFSIILDTVGSSSKSMHEAFEIATGIAISPEDSLTRSACGICYTRLKIIIDVRQRAKESYENIISQQKKLILLEKGIKTIKVETGQVSLSFRLCFICHSKESLTEIEKKTNSNPQDFSKNTLLKIYESVIGISVPGDLTFLCEKCIDYLRESSLFMQTQNKNFRRSFKCKYCGQMLTLNACKLHLETHHNKRQIACNICSMAFTTSEYLITHLEKHYAHDECKCSICLVKYEDFFSYQEHFPCQINYGDGETNEDGTSGEIFLDKDCLSETSQNIKMLDKNICIYCHDELISPIALTHHLQTKHSKSYCHICKRFLSGNHEFILHMDTHITDNYYFCRMCWEEFDNISDYEHHGLIFHLMNVCRKCTYMCKMKIPLNSIKIYSGCDKTCKPCSKTFQTFAEYESHVHQIHNSCPIYGCYMCGLQFGELIYYIRHMKVYHNVISSDIKTLFHAPDKKHIRLHEIYKQIVCKICSEDFQHNSAFWDHTESEHPENICKICSKVFTTVGIMKKHLERHSIDLPNLCTICAKLFPNPKSYRRHRRTKHKEYLCHICSEAFTFANKKILLDHMDGHISEEYYICRDCFKEFKEIENYRCHVKTFHKKVICNLCSYTCNFPSKMKFHLVVHSRARPYACNICSRRFHTQKNVKVHAVKHAAKYAAKRSVNQTMKYAVKRDVNNTTNPSNRCDICNVIFTTLSSLTSHNRIVHRSFNCKVCSTTFLISNEFINHVIEATSFYYRCKEDEQRYLCKICLFDFDNISSCELHFKVIHGNMGLKI